jgi:serine/threonine-protein kinase
MDNAIRSPEQLSGTTQPAAASPPDEVDWTGQVVGEFRILHRLGRGGMGQVYLAEQTSLKRKVALKLLHPDLASNERSLLRFKAEAENVARATHANIVQIYTIGAANGVNYLALEYVEGRNLREFIERKGTPELSLGLHIMAQVAAALQRASEFQIIHRDIKPENILLTKKGEVKVADFGLSRCFAEEAHQSITQSQVSMGTPLYMSPEQVERGAVDRRTDIYSFGVTCYHMFAGHPPFRGNSPIEVAYQHVHKEPQPLGEIRPDLPLDLIAIIQKMMAKKPDDRYQSAGEIVRDINRLREALNLGAVGAISISSSFIGGTSDALRNSGTQTISAVAPQTPINRRVGGAVAVVLALAAGLALGWYFQHPPPVNHHAALPVEDPGPPKAAITLKKREEALLERVQEHLKPENRLDAMAGVKHCVDLGLFYLKQKRLDDADAFFKSISNPDRKTPAYGFLGRMGHAIVLAFRDEPAASNKEFLLFFEHIELIEKRPAKGGLAKKDLQKANIEAYEVLWKDNPPLREMVAKALNFNYANDVKNFPPGLDAYRLPPRPKLNAPPP